MCPLQQEFLVVKTVHQEQTRKLTKNVNLKREQLTVPPRQRRQNLIELEPAHKNIKFQNLRIKSARCSILP